MTISFDSHEGFDGEYLGVFVGDECRGVAERRKFIINGSHGENTPFLKGVNCNPLGCPTKLENLKGILN